MLVDRRSTGCLSMPHSEKLLGYRFSQYSNRDRENQQRPDDAAESGCETASRRCHGSSNCSAQRKDEARKDHCVPINRGKIGTPIEIEYKLSPNEIANAVVLAITPIKAIRLRQIAASAALLTWM